MRHLTSRTVVALALAALLAGSISGCATFGAKKEVHPTPAAVQEKPGSGPWLMDHYVQVTGGKAAYDKLQNRVTKMNFQIPAQGLTGEATVTMARPNLFRSVIVLTGLGTIERGFDGTVAWETSMMSGPRILEGGERQDLIREALFDKYVNWRAVYKSAEVAGEVTLADRPVYKVAVTPLEGAPETFYFDKETGLLVKVDLVLATEMGMIPVEVTTGDYRPVDGVRLPHLSKVMVMGQERVLTVQSVQHNVPLSPDQFAPPKEIKELWDKKQAIQ